MGMKGKQALLGLMYRGLWPFTGMRRKRVLFGSFSAKSYSDNPRAISEKLHEMDPGLQIVWLNQGQSLMGVPDYVRQVSRRDFVAYYRALASSRVIVMNYALPPVPKRKNQRFIQTWHGDRAFKKVLYDSAFVGPLNLMEARPGYCDLAVAGSDYGERQYRSAFRYPGEVLLAGTPRDDILLHVNDALIRQKQREIGLQEGPSYLLYAPTLRRASHFSEQKQQIQGIDLMATLAALEKRLGGEWKCLLRAHPNCKGLSGLGTDSAAVIDVSDYPDMADLLIVSDALITDYSSCAGDFALLKRPLFLFQDDLDDYLKNDRALYFDMADSPYWAARSQEELLALIAAATREKAAANCEEILAFYGTHETGKAAAAVAERIIAYCNA